VKLEMKRSLGGRRIRWEDNIETDFKEMGCEAVEQNNLVWYKAEWLAIVNRIIWFGIR
jgi:hypothetical protein